MSNAASRVARIALEGLVDGGGGDGDYYGEGLKGSLG